MKGKKFKATLSHPVGINASLRVGFNRKSRRRVVIKSKRALNWEDIAILELRQAGLKPQPEGMYWCAVQIDLYTSRLDIDAPLKYTLDLLMKALSREERTKGRRVYVGVDDKWFGQLIVHKHFVTPKIDQRLEVQIELIPISSKREFNDIGNKRRK